LYIMCNKFNMLYLPTCHFYIFFHEVSFKVFQMFLCVVLGIKSWATHITGKHSTTEP
jgi:hypothetical protein